MKSKRMLIGFASASIVVCAIVGWGPSYLAAQPVGSASAADLGGNIGLPLDYRENYQFLGSWAVAADSGQGSKEMHIVYVSPGASTAYRSSNNFPDGTILVKEVYEARTNEMTTGAVSRVDHLKGWFVMVRDAKNTHPGNPLWGDGWGWSWFDAANRTKTTTLSYKTECQGCHVPARASQWIYVDGYPSLGKGDK